MRFNCKTVSIPSLPVQTVWTTEIVATPAVKMCARELTREQAAALTLPPHHARGARYNMSANSLGVYVRHIACNVTLQNVCKTY